MAPKIDVPIATSDLPVEVPETLNTDVATALGQGPNFWSSMLASLDSDGDGFNNGEELGDTDGDGIPEAGASVTLPGDSTDFPEIVQPPVDNEAPTIVLVGEEIIQYHSGQRFRRSWSACQRQRGHSTRRFGEWNRPNRYGGHLHFDLHCSRQAGNQSVVITRLIHVTPSSTTLHLRREGTGLVLEWGTWRSSSVSTHSRWTVDTHGRRRKPLLRCHRPQTEIFFSYSISEHGDRKTADFDHLVGCRP